MGAEAAQRGTPQRVSETVGGYRLLGCLSDGMTGTSYLAASKRAEFGEYFVLANRVGIVGKPPDDLGKRLRSEALLTTRIEHPNAVRTLGVIQQKESCYWITEYLHGQPFSKLVRESRIAPHVSLRMRLQVIRDALAGLHAAHQLRDQYGRCLHVVHAGMRPSNLIVTYDGIVKVVGFGVARALASTPNWRDIPGKLRYLAPEQLVEDELDRRADVFSLGVMLWESISLRKFASHTLDSRTAIERRLAGAEPRIAQVTPQVPVQLARICDKAMNVNRKERFQTAREFQEALNEYMAGSGTLYKPSSLGQIVAQKFETERVAVQRLLAHESRERDEPKTAVQVRRPHPQDDDGEETMIYDTSQLIEESRVRPGRVAPTARGARRRKSPQAGPLAAAIPLMLLGLILLAFWLAYHWANGAQLGQLLL